jgi:predicted TIM-barrel fold metal-dependent hydrolase
LNFFDCDVAYGRGAIALPREIETAEDLLAELDHSGIHQALVWHRDAWERDFDLGNQRLIELDAYPRLHPTMTFVPTCCQDMPSAEEFVRAARAANVKAARAFPSRHCFALDPLVCGDLLDLFSACGLPVLMPLPEVPGGWQGVYQLMRDFPRLPLVLTETGCWGQDRYFRPLMRKYERFFITTNRLETAGQLQSIVDKVGPDHVVFGSGLPRNYAGGYVLMLYCAEIPEEAREAIAHGNLERLIGKIAW